MPRPSICLHLQAEIEQSYAAELDKLYDKFARATKRRLAKSGRALRWCHH